MNESIDMMIVTYDELQKVGDSSWWLVVDGELYFFPFSCCELKEDDGQVIAPAWLVRKMELEAYAEEI